MKSRGKKREINRAAAAGSPPGGLGTTPLRSALVRRQPGPWPRRSPPPLPGGAARGLRPSLPAPPPPPGASLGGLHPRKAQGGGGAIPVVPGGLGSPRPPLLLFPLGWRWPGLVAGCPEPGVELRGRHQGRTSLLRGELQASSCGELPIASLRKKKKKKTAVEEKR